MRSMTGHGSARLSGFVVQISSVNHKHVQVRIGGDLQDLVLEQRIQTLVRDRLLRGSIQIRVRREEIGLPVSPARLTDAWRRLASLAKQLGAPVPTLEGVARILHHDANDQAQDESVVLNAIEQALKELETFRAEEGTRLKGVFSSAQSRMSVLSKEIRTLCAARPQTLHDRLHARIAALAPQLAGLSSTDLAREVALEAQRIDVEEELTRLDCHLARLAELLKNKEPAQGLGRTLEFLFQEIHREINTLGVKANDTNVSPLIVEAKVLVDECKEQAANIL
jgi:uncharacterized protein (TIGR00255 family)